jgi:hypothetical protein
MVAGSSPARRANYFKELANGLSAPAARLSRLYVRCACSWADRRPSGSASASRCKRGRSSVILCVISFSSVTAAIGSGTARRRGPIGGTRSPSPTRGLLEPASVVPSAGPGPIEFNITVGGLPRPSHARKQKFRYFSLSLFSNRGRNIVPTVPIAPNPGEKRSKSGTIPRGRSSSRGGYRPRYGRARGVIWGNRN